MFCYTILVHLFYKPLFYVLIVVNSYFLMGINEFFISHFLDYNSVSVTVTKSVHNCSLDSKAFFLIFLNETVRLSRNVCATFTTPCCVITQTSAVLLMFYVVVCKVKNAVDKVILCFICVIFFNRGEKFVGKWGRVLNYNNCQRREQDCSYVETGASRTKGKIKKKKIKNYGDISRCDAPYS
jgi:hypothetical protein